MFLLHPNYAHTAESFSSYKLRSHSRRDHLTSLTSGIHLWHQNSLALTVKVWIKAIHTRMHSPFPLYLLLRASLHPTVAWKGEKSRSSSQAVAPGAHPVARLCVPEAGLQDSVWASTSAPGTVTGDLRRECALRITFEAEGCVITQHN